MRHRVRRYCVAGWLVVAGCGSAIAADIPYPVKAPVPVQVLPNWAGFYIGGQIGVGNDSVHWRNLGGSPVYSPPGSLTIDRGGGAIGGGQAGYNFQVGRVVLGVEGSLSAADFDRSFPSPWFPTTDTWSSKVSWLGTVTGRVGYGFDAWMPYLKAGLAAGNVETSIASSALGVSNQGSAVHYGWTAGAGVEFKVASKFSLGLEFMHTNLGRNNDINGQSVPGTTETYSVGARSNSFMARFNYLFGVR